MVVLPPARIGTAPIKAKEAVGQQSDTDQRGIPTVTYQSDTHLPGDEGDELRDTLLRVTSLW